MTDVASRAASASSSLPRCRTIITATQPSTWALTISLRSSPSLLLPRDSSPSPRLSALRRNPKTPRPTNIPLSRIPRPIHSELPRPPRLGIAHPAIASPRRQPTLERPGQESGGLSRPSTATTTALSPPRRKRRPWATRAMLLPHTRPFKISRPSIGDPGMATLRASARLRTALLPRGHTTKR